MKNLLIALPLILITLNSYSQGDAKAMYEKNLASVKAAIAAFEKEDIEGWASFVADDVNYQSPVYGDNDHSKAHWKAALKYYTDNWDEIKLVNATFLPGLDSATQVMDGSVRYYGEYTAVHKSGVKTRVSLYATFDFNKDHKVVSCSEFFDVGGLMEAVKPKN